MDRVDRPLSPHATLYSWRITNTLSIIHRLTGVFLSLGAFVLAWWLMSLAGGPSAYESALLLIDTVFFKLLATAWVFSFFFHLANGVRHLFWDVGHGFEPAQIRASGWAVVVFAVIVAAAYAVTVVF
jgi:succinate dehydrogenase / fumarate reductase cytochrome b subunit